MADAPNLSVILHKNDIQDRVYFYPCTAPAAFGAELP